MRGFVFLDRDGTLIVEKHYLADPDQVQLIDGAAAALRRLRESGYGVAVITNQSGLGRGYFDAERLEAVHARMRELLAREGARLDGIYVCPHTPDEGCSCRKPAAGLVEMAARDHQFERQRSFIIGDKSCDIECGKNAGIVSILVRTGYGREMETEIGASADHVADSLPEAVEWILRSGPGTFPPT
jgi:D-glycero-D-manno-heptose 1,7-bisphosphate phosphatase